MTLDPTLLTLSLLFSAAGMGLFMYGKKATKIPHLVAGVALMTCPYFISNAIALTSICVIIAITPFLMPET
jgi:hypothetical protein